MTTRFIRGFWTLERLTPSARPFVWRTFYNAVAVGFPHEDLQFMNWGYLPDDGEAPLTLNPDDEPRRTLIQLYAHTLGDVDVGGRDVIEVGSGRGGGASWIAREHSPRSMLGIDIAPRAVALARRMHKGIPNLRFEPGNALALPLAAASVDAVVNVESCHHYGSMPAFLREVARVLRPGGHLLLSDYREAHEMPALEQEVRTSGFECLRHRDITKNVLAALSLDNDAKESLLRERVPRPLHQIMRTFMGNRGTDVFEGFRTRRWLYASWVLQKPEAVS